jgi:hypothetical protein
VNSVGSGKGVLVGGDGKNSVVLALLEGTTEVLTSLGNIAVTLAHGPDTSTVKGVDGADNLIVRVGAGLRVVVTKGAGFVDVLRGVVVASRVLGEGLQRSVTVLGLALVPLGHGAHDVAVGDIGVGSNELEHGKKTVDVEVVKPENGIEGSNIEVGHVAAALTTSRDVDEIVDRLDAVDTATAQVGADTDSSSAGSTPVGLAGEESKETITDRDADGGKASVHLVVVAARRVGDRAAKGFGEVVPWTSTHLSRKRATPAVAVERVVNRDTTLGFGDGDLLVADLGRDSRAAAWIPSVVPEGHTEGRGDAAQTGLLVAGELLNHLEDAFVPSLLWKIVSYGERKKIRLGVSKTYLVSGKVGPVP